MDGSTFNKLHAREISPRLFPLVLTILYLFLLFYHILRPLNGFLFLVRNHPILFNRTHRRLLRLLPIIIITHRVLFLRHVNSLTLSLTIHFTHHPRPISLILCILPLSNFRYIHRNVMRTTLNTTLMRLFHLLIRHLVSRFPRPNSLNLILINLTLFTRLLRTMNHTRPIVSLLLYVRPYFRISNILHPNDIRGILVMLFRPDFRLIVYLRLLSLSLHRRSLRLLNNHLCFLNISDLSNLGRPIMLPNNTIQDKVRILFSNLIPLLSHIRPNGRHLRVLLTIIMKRTRRRRRLTHHIDPNPFRTINVVIRLFFNRLTNILVRRNIRLNRTNRHIISNQGSNRTRTIMITGRPLTISTLPHYPRLTSTNMITRRTVTRLMRGTSTGTNGNRVPIFILRIVPPIRGGLCRCPRPNSRHHLRSLTTNHVPRPLRDLHPIYFHFFHDNLTLHRPKHIIFYLYFLRYHLYLIIPLPLNHRVLRNTCRSLNILLTLNTRRTRNLRRLILQTLRSYPLRRNVIKLYPLRRPPRLTRRNFLMDLTTILRHLNKRIDFHRIVFNRILLCVILDPIRRTNRHRLIRPTGTSTHGIYRDIRNSNTMPRRRILTIPNPIINNTRRTLFFHHITRFPPTTTPRTNKRRKVSGTMNAFGSTIRLTKLRIRRGLRNEYANSTPTRLYHYHKRTYYLRRNRIRISHRRNNDNVTPRRTTRIIGRLTISLTPTRINRNLLRMLTSNPSPTPFGNSMLYLTTLRAIRRLLNIPRQSHRTYGLNNVFCTLTNLLRRTRRDRKFKTILSNLRMTLTTRARIPTRTLILLRGNISIRIRISMIFCPNALCTMRNRTNLISMPLYRLTRLPRVTSPRIVMDHRILFSLTGSTNTRHILPLTSLMNIRLTTILISNRRLTRHRDLKMLLSRPNGTLNKGTRIHGNNPTMRGIIRTLPILRLCPRLNRRIVNRRPKLTIPNL